MAGGEFAASPLYDHDVVRTGAEILNQGWITERHFLRLGEERAEAAIADLASSSVCEIHESWFRTTFPNEAGVLRFGEILNRKETASPAMQVREDLVNAIRDFQYRWPSNWPDDVDEQIVLKVEEVNTLTVRVYDIHPFIDGNTRATWTLRNYLLVSCGLDGLSRLDDTDRYEAAWWSSTPSDHALLDEVVLEELVAIEGRRAAHNRRS